MDPTQTTGAVQASGDSAPAVEVSPMGEGWAPGVSRAPVSGGSRRLRWGIAGAIMMCVVLVTAGGFYVLSGAAGAKSLTAGVAPRNTVAFLEVRTDLPGDQHAKLADFMSHFPGFMDRSQFNTGLDQLLNRMTRAVSPDLTYTSAFKPWMEGEVSIAVTDIGGLSPAAALSNSGSLQMMTPTPCGGGITPCTTDLPNLPLSSPAPGVVAIVALKDHDAAKLWVANELTKSGVATTASQYAGTTLYSFGTGLNAGAYALTDQDLLMGTIQGVEAALDSHTAGSLADNPNYQAAMNSLSGDSLARFYFDPATIVKAELSGMSSMMGSIGASSSVANLVGEVPAWVAGNVRADSGQLMVNVVMPRSSSAQTADDSHVSRLAPSLPGSTVLVTEVHGLGKTLTTALSAVQKQMPNDSSLGQIQNALGLVGGLDWIGDASVVVTKNGSIYDGGVVVEATDATTAGAKVALLHNMLALAGSSLNTTSRDETYKGVNITLIHVASTPDSTVGGLDIAVAAKDKLIVAGVDDAFVKAVIDTGSGSSLASQSDYSNVMNAVGSNNSQSLYLNIPALEDQIGQAFFNVSPSRWTLDYKPYFDHLGGVGYAVTGGNTVILRFIVTAK
jgi:hypothetical protein